MQQFTVVQHQQAKVTVLPQGLSSKRWNNNGNDFNNNDVLGISNKEIPRPPRAGFTCVAVRLVQVTRHVMWQSKGPARPWASGDGKGCWCDLGFYERCSSPLPAMLWNVMIGMPKRRWTGEKRRRRARKKVMTHTHIPSDEKVLV